MPEKLKVLGICGSLRRQSYNAILLNETVKFCADIADIEVFDRLAVIPPFNQDDERNPPAAVQDLKQQILAADAILFVTPEYNYSIPGVLKNAIDWASRPPGESVWDGKCGAVMGVSSGKVGTARAQYHLRQTFVYLNMYSVNRPEVMVTAKDSFSAEGQLTDAKTKELVLQLLTELKALCDQRKQATRQTATAS